MPSAVVLGGGLAGVAAAASLARSGWKKVTIVERGPELGGLAGSFERADHFYPLGYHHILHRDRPLHYFLDQIGALSDVRWRKIRMLFHLDDRLFDLTRPADFAAYPMSLTDKIRFVGLMMRCFRKSDWSDWNGRNAQELIDSWAGAGVREALFERLSRLKFGRPCAEVSAAWLGARLHFREGSSPLGYMPDHNWTKVLCDGLTNMVEDAGVAVRLETSGRALRGKNGRIEELELSDGERLAADIFISTVPTEVYCRMVDGDATPYLDKIRYTAIVSAICATKQKIAPDFYWLNMMSLQQSASGFFHLSSLNPSIGQPGDSCLNFMTHVPSRHDDFFKQSDEKLWQGYYNDFEEVFGFRVEPFWTNMTKIPMYSPVLVPDYQNPPIRSTGWNNVYFAGNYRTFPSTVTTGTALYSGLEAAHEILSDHGQKSSIKRTAADFRLPSMPRPVD